MPLNYKGRAGSNGDGAKRVRYAEKPAAIAPTVKTKQLLKDRGKDTDAKLKKIFGG